VNADISDITRLLGYRRNKKPAAGLANMLDESVKEAEELIHPSGLFAIFEKKSFPSGSFLSSLFEENDAAVAKIGLAVCTIGPMLEERVSSYSDSGQLTRALMIDAAGSSLTESSCDVINEKMCRIAAERSLYTAPRISPGYGHWKIEEQAIVFDLLPGDSIGISLTESYVMIPRKSVSFAVAFMTEIPADRPASPCKRCGRRDCQFRREP